MGTGVHIVVAEDDARLLPTAFALVEELEERWSRFRPASELSILNRHTGRPVLVSAETFDVIARAVDGTHLTGGRFDPTVHDALVAWGYDRTFTELGGTTATRAHSGAKPDGPAPGVGGIELDEPLHAVTVPVGVHLDLGGIGKGAAADLVAARLVELGAAGASVSLGGDVRVVGPSPLGVSWPLTLPTPAGDLVTHLADGAACTSTVDRRRWHTPAGLAHHLIDPATGDPVVGDLRSATVFAADATGAEIMTKAVMVAGRAAGLDLLSAAGLEGVVVDTAGRVHVRGAPLARAA